jgi:acyl carrier protein
MNVSLKRSKHPPDWLDGERSLTYEVLNRKNVDFSPDLLMEQVEGWDSYVAVDLILAIETQFQVTIPLSEIGRFRRVGDFAELIGAKSQQP